MSTEMAGAHGRAPADTDVPAFGTVLRAGLLGGLIAGLFGALMALLVVEPPIREALVIEESRAAGGGGHEHGELVGRTAQVVGGMLAVVILGVVLGTVFAVVYARLRHRLPGRTDTGRASALALVGFVVVSLLPGVKYPANPPAVGDPDTVGQRTLLYLSPIAAGVVVAAAVWTVRAALASRASPSTTSVLTGFAAVLGFGLLVAVWPTNPDVLPADVPADLIWRFRLSSLAELAVVWAALAAVTGWSLDRARGTISGTGGVRSPDR